LAGLDLQDMDITDGEAVQRKIRELEPKIVVNAAAYNQVDLAEGEGKAQAWAVNSAAVRHLAQACRGAGAALVHFSTDYVFPGRGETPYTETDPPDPLGEYGRSKLDGERQAALCPEAYVFRVCGLFGTAGRRAAHPNFVERMLALAGDGRKLRVVSDQVLTPSYTLDLAPKVWQVLARRAPGLYHLTNAGSCSWFEFSRAIFELEGLRVDLSPTTLGELGAPAPRPPYSVLAHQALRALDLDDLPHWRDALSRYLRERRSQPRT